MGKDYARSRRVGEEIQRILSEIIRRDLKDPRLQYLTITAVDVSGDLSHANIFVSPLDPNSDPGPLLEALESASGFMRRGLGRSLKTRHTPQLHFALDKSIEHGSRLTSLIDSLVEQDENRRDNHDKDDG